MIDTVEILDTLHPLDPIPTRFPESLRTPSPIKAVLFDIYGTLLISGTGDVGSAAPESRGADLNRVFNNSGFSGDWEKLEFGIPERLERAIRRVHQELRDQGADYPEVEIRSVWSRVLGELRDEGFLNDTANDRVEELAFRYELMVNPVWPMPGYPKIIQDLSESGLRIGIVSNAQFYTRPLLETFSGTGLAEIGFEENLFTWSYELLRAKPSSEMFVRPLKVLEKSGIRPSEVLYVGNDMLNDVATAASAGCRTCLFAGDKRSLRLRENDSRATAKPDMVIGDLSRLEYLMTGD